MTLELTATAAPQDPIAALDRALEHFWHPVCTLDELEAVAPRPLAVELLGRKIAVADLGAAGVSAIADRCLHRSTRLSVGWVDERHVPLRLPRLALGGRRALRRDPVHARRPDPAEGVHPDVRGRRRLRPRVGAPRRFGRHGDPGLPGVGRRRPCGSSRASRTRGRPRRPGGSRTSSTSRTSPGCTTARWGAATHPVPPLPQIRREAASCASSTTRRTWPPRPRRCSGYSRYRMPIPLHRRHRVPARHRCARAASG